MSRLLACKLDCFYLTDLKNVIMNGLRQIVSYYKFHTGQSQSSGSWCSVSVFVWRSPHSSQDSLNRDQRPEQWSRAFIEHMCKYVKDCVCRTQALILTGKQVVGCRLQRISTSYFSWISIFILPVIFSSYFLLLSIYEFLERTCYALSLLYF